MSERPVMTFHPDDNPGAAVCAWWEANGGQVIESIYVPTGKVITFRPQPIRFDLGALGVSE